MDDRFVLQGNLIILDTKTGLAWQRGAAEYPMVCKDGYAYIQKLNESKFAGYDDWRFPNKEEMGSLIMSEEDRNTGLYLHSLFSSQRNLWTSTEAGHHRACYVDFYYGDVYVIEQNYANYYVRAVRTAQA